MIVYFSVYAVMGVIFAVRNSNLAQTQRVKNYLYWMVWIMLCGVVALRYNVGTDYNLYRVNYLHRYVSTWAQILAGPEEPGACVIAWLSHIIYDDYATWFAIMAIISILPCGWLIQRESIAPCLSTVLFVVLTCWDTSFNIVLQCAAIGILVFGYRALRDRCFWKWCLVCAIAYIFHDTALILMPVYFLVTTKITWKRILFYLILGVVILMSYDEIAAFIAATKRGTATDLSSAYGSNQLNIFRVLVHCAPPVMATILLRYYDKNDKQFCLLYNMSLFNAILNVGTMNSAYLNRFVLYTMFYNALFIPYLVKPFKRNTRIAIWIVMLALYTIFWVYGLYICPETVNFYWIFERGV